MDSEVLSKFMGYFPDYLSALSRTLLSFFGTTFVKTAVYITGGPSSSCERSSSCVLSVECNSRLV